MQHSNKISALVILLLSLAAWPSYAQNINPLSCTISGSTITCGGSSITPATNALTSGHLFVGNGANIAADIAVSGDLSLASSGAFTLTAIRGVAVSGTTGTGSVVFSAAPTFSGTVTTTTLTTTTLNIGGTLTSNALSSITLSLSGNASLGAATVAVWNSDTGISRISAGILGIGTGAQGSIAGGLQLATSAVGGCSLGNTVSCVTGKSLFTGAMVSAINGALSTPAVAITGTISNVGTATTNKPLVLIEPSGTTSAAWSTAGTGFAVNAATGFTGNLIDLQLSGASKFSVSSSGAVATGGALNVTGGITASALTTTTAFMYFTGLSSDSGVADSTLCVATTSGQVYKGSGVAGICVGTSSIRYKHDIQPLSAGLNEIMGLQAVSYVPNNQDKVLYGFTAEQGGTVLPQLMGRDDQGRPNTFDYLGVVPVLVKAIQEQQKQIDELKRERSSNPH